MASHARAIKGLVIANRILADQGIVDAFGDQRQSSVSMRRGWEYWARRPDTEICWALNEPGSLCSVILTGRAESNGRVECVT